MNSIAALPPVQVLSVDECEAVFSGASWTDADPHSDQALPLPVSEVTWQTYYETKVPGKRQPWWIHRNAERDSVWALALIEADLAYFRGHFPNQPLLPGVVQINWAVALGAQALAAEFGKQQFAGLARVKFKAPVLPGAILRFQLQPAPGRIALTIASRNGVHTEGRLLYRG
ncbi:MAG: 3-hydroxyacyl-ACP dehydratase FabZ family protein [Pseudomonadales bacterium]